MEVPVGTVKRKRWPLWAKVLVGALLAAWPLVVFFGINRFAIRSTTDVAWEKGAGGEAPAEFSVLVFPVAKDAACASALSSVNRAVITTVGELAAPELEVFVGRETVRVPAGCLVFLPSTATWDALVANLNRDVRMWRRVEAGWMRVRATRQEIGGGAFEVKFVRMTNEGIDTFVYQTDGASAAPVRWERVVGSGAGVTGAAMLLMVLAAHFFVMTVILVWWQLRRRARNAAAASAGA